MSQPIYYECGICDCIHPWDFQGDCRDDANRFAMDELEEKHGGLGFELRSMDERVAADEKPEVLTFDIAQERFRAKPKSQWLAYEYAETACEYFADGMIGKDTLAAALREVADALPSTEEEG